MADNVAFAESVCASVPQPWIKKLSMPNSDNPITIVLEYFVFVNSFIAITPR
jgi:hypothetical protein